MKQHKLILTLIILLALDSQVFAKTISKKNYADDIRHNSNYIFGLIDINFDAPEYKDPNLEDAIQLPSPLYNPLYSTYDIIVIANKTDLNIGNNLIEKGQTLRVYIRSEALNTLHPSQSKHIEFYHPETGLLYYWTISTARPEKITPPGFYTIQGFSSEHESSLYNNSPMPWTLFFNEDIATHGVLENSLKKLGEPRSAGCIRLEPQRARDLFHLVGIIGKGLVDSINPSTGHPLVTSEDTIQQEEKYKTLIIVKD